MALARTPVLDHVTTMKIRLGDRFKVGAGGLGSRMVAEIVGLEADGPRLQATMAGAAGADWLTLAPDRSYGILDVRVTLQTPNGDLIYVEYSGRIDMAGDRGVVAAPTMQTGSEDYAWVNQTQFLAVGEKLPDGIVYELFEVNAARS